MSNADRSEDRQQHPISTSRADALIAACAAKPSAKIIIVGAEQIDLLLAFLRRDFACVECVSAASGPNPQRDGADVVVASAVRSEPDLLHILKRFGGTLSPHGALVIGEASASIGDDKRLRRILLEAGFGAVERHPSCSGFERLWCAYKQDAALARAA